jgi:uncharacterized protein (TIGR02678 family)
MHALLNRPWIVKDEEPDLYYAIRDHYEELRTWFMEKAGLPLIITRSFAKLDKTPVKAQAWMGFPEFRGKLDYVFFTYGLWYLEGKTELDQFLLSDIVEEIREQMLSAGLEADWRVYSDRLAMARALKKLRALGVLLSIDGDESHWAQSEEHNVLYECSPLARYVLRRFPADLTSYTEMQSLTDPISYADTQDGQAMRRRHRVYRRLLLEPAVTDRQWDEEDLNYVLWQRRAIIDQLEHMLGWTGHRYREGLFFFHPDLTAECDLFPTVAAVSDVALLVASELRKQLGAATGERYVEDDGMVRLTKADLEHVLSRVQMRHSEFWGKELRNASSGQLAELCMNHLLDWGLGEREGETTLLISPVLARWISEYKNIQFD